MLTKEKTKELIGRTLKKSYKEQVFPKVSSLIQEHSEVEASSSTSGHLSPADKVKLDGIETGATRYIHPDGDGNLHVPATGETNQGKVLKAGKTAGSLQWEDVAWSDVTNKPETFKPASHGHKINEIEGLKSALDEVANSLATFEDTVKSNEETRQHNEQLREQAESNRQSQFTESQNQRDTDFNEKMEEYREYVSGLQGIQGKPGETPQIQVNETHIQVKYPSQQDWTDLIPLEMLQGPEGLQGLQGKQGDPGEQGIQGLPGKDGADGRDGITPNLQIGTVTTLEAGQEATVTKRGTKEEPIFDFGIPRGPNGKDGKDGQSLILKDTLVTTPIIDATLTLTTDKYQSTVMQNNTTIALPNVNSFAEIHLFFNTTSELTLTLPNIKWQTQPTIEANKVYEFIFTYVNEWLGGVVCYNA